MENYNTWKLIKAGFWLGIGFIVPTIIVYIIGTILIDGVLTPMFYATASKDKYEQVKTFEETVGDYDKTDQVKVLEYREAKNGDQLLILGKVENQGTTPVSSIEIEAELFDGSKKLVYECSEHISKRLNQGETENFQIKCGCGNQPVPEHESVTVRVVNASNF
jgi:hypothetical protein